MAVVIPLEQFTDMHKGRRAWMLGCGPSINGITDEQWLEIDKDITLGVNHIAAIHDVGFLVWIDKGIGCSVIRPPNSKWPEAVAGEPSPYMAGSKAKYKITRTKNIHADAITVKLNKKNPNLNAADGLYCSGSSSQAALHMAIILGCNPIVLLGIDYNNYSHCYKTTKDRPEMNYPGAAKTIQRFGPMRDLATKHGRKVYNASLDSEMEMFEKRTIGDILSGPARGGCGAGRQFRRL